MLLLMFALLGSPVALAQSAPTEAQLAQAKDLFMSGRTLYEEGRYEEAIQDWQESHRLSGEPVLLYNIANAYERLGDYDNAIRTLEQYKLAADPGERAAIERRVESLTIRRDQLAAQQAPPETTTPPPSDPGTNVGTVEPSRPPIAPIALMGVGVAGLGAGAAFGLSARGARAEASSLCLDGYCPDTAAEAISQDRRMSALADVGFVVGGVSLATGATLLLLGGRQVSDTLTLSGGLGALQLSGSF